MSDMWNGVEWLYVPFLGGALWSGVFWSQGPECHFAERSALRAPIVI